MGKESRILSTVIKVWLGLVLFGFTAVLAGCGGKDDKNTAIQGWIHGDDGVSGASLTAYRVADNLTADPIETNGNILSSERGTFMLYAKNLPADFRIVASGGVHQGQASKDVFAADVRNHDPAKRDLIRINLITTMVSAYLDSHPDKTLAEATQTVRDFLAIPDWVNLSRGLRGHERYFDTDKFMSEAGAKGGVNAYITQLIVEIDSAGIGLTHTFASTKASTKRIKLPHRYASPRRIDIVGSIGDGILSMVKGALTGWALSALGLENLKDVNKGDINALADMITDLKTTVTSLGNEIIALIQQTAYETQVTTGPIADMINNIGTITDQYEYLLSHTWKNSDGTTDEAAIKEKIDHIKELIGDNIIDKYNVIPNALADNSGAATTSLLKQYGVIVSSNTKRFFSNADSLKMQNQFDYFDHLQQLVLLYRVEYFHARHDTVTQADIDEATNALNYYNDQKDAQRSILNTKDPIPLGVVIDKARSIMWYVGTGSNPPISSKTYEDGVDAVAALNTTSLDSSTTDDDSWMVSSSMFGDWQLPVAHQDDTTDELWALFDGHCSKNDTSATLANLNAQGWPLWTSVNRIGNQVARGAFTPYNITSCDYDDAVNAWSDELYYDFIPYRVIENDGFMENYFW